MQVNYLWYATVDSAVNGKQTDIKELNIYGVLITAYFDVVYM